MKALRALVFLALLAGMASAGGWAGQPARAQGPDQLKQLLDLFQDVDESDLPEFIRDVRNGPKELKRQRARARRMGVPLNGKELVPEPPRDEDNAAVIYRQLMDLLKAHPVDRDVLDPILYDSRRRELTVDEVAAARKLIHQRRDVMDLIYQATDRPVCDFARDWDQGTWLTFPEFSFLRLCARLLRVEGYVLAREGRYAEAIGVQARGFRLAQHAASDPSLLGLLVGAAIDGIALQGMEDLLHMAGRRQDVPAAVRDALEAPRPHYDFKRALTGEVVMDIATVERAKKIKDHPARVLSQLAGTDEAELKRYPRLKKGERRIWKQLYDAGEADVLRLLLDAIEATDLPRPALVAAYQKLDDEVEQPTSNPVHIFRMIAVPLFRGVVNIGPHQGAARDCQMAGAAA